MNNVLFSKDALSDLHSLPKNSLNECITLCSKLASNTHLGKALSNHSGRDLTGYYSLYFNNAKHRIVYKINNSTNEAKVIAIGERDKFHVYDLAFARKEE